jgi:hypothetical protein
MKVARLGAVNAIGFGSDSSLEFGHPCLSGPILTFFLPPMSEILSKQGFGGDAFDAVSQHLNCQSSNEIIDVVLVSVFPPDPGPIRVAIRLTGFVESEHFDPGDRELINRSDTCNEPGLGIQVNGFGVRSIFVGFTFERLSFACQVPERVCLSEYGAI